MLNGSGVFTRLRIARVQAAKRDAAEPLLEKILFIFDLAIGSSGELGINPHRSGAAQPV
jgi:hypothetical protein